MIHILALLAALPLMDQPAPRVTGVTAVASGQDVLVTIALNVPASPTAATMLRSPWRLYFDLPGVRPGVRTPAASAGVVSRVRLALNQPNPARTRVVIDLAREVQWRVERGGDGRSIRVILRDMSAVPLIDYTPPAEPAPAVDRRQTIRTQVIGMRAMVEAMRAWTGPSDAELVTLMAAIDQLSAGARAMAVSTSAEDQALVAAIDAVGAAAAARARALAENTPQSRANAIAAASGARILLSAIGQ